MHEDNFCVGATALQNSGTLLQTVKYSSRPLAVKPGFSFLSSNEQFFQKVIWSSRLQLDYSWHCYSYITFTLLYF